MPIIHRQETFFISGEMTFATVAELWNVSKVLFPLQASWQCDFSGVTACDSASIALLLEWKKYAMQLHKSIRYLHLPQQLFSIAAASGLAELLS